MNVKLASLLLNISLAYNRNIHIIFQARCKRPSLVSVEDVTAATAG